MKLGVHRKNNSGASTLWSQIKRLVCLELEWFELEWFREVHSSPSIIPPAPIPVKSALLISNASLIPNIASFSYK